MMDWERDAIAAAAADDNDCRWIATSKMGETMPIHRECFLRLVGVRCAGRPSSDNPYWLCDNTIDALAFLIVAIQLTHDRAAASAQAAYARLHRLYWRVAKLEKLLRLLYERNPPTLLYVPLLPRLHCGPRVFVFPATFVPKLFLQVYRYQHVERTLRKMHFRPCDSTEVIFPYNPTGNHWLLFRWLQDEKRIEVWDSLGSNWDTEMVRFCFFIY